MNLKHILYSSVLTYIMFGFLAFGNSIHYPGNKQIPQKYHFSSSTKIITNSGMAFDTIFVSFQDLEDSIGDLVSINTTMKQIFESRKILDTKWGSLIYQADILQENNLNLSQYKMKELKTLVSTSLKQRTKRQSSKLYLFLSVNVNTYL